MASFASRIVRWQRKHGRHDLPWQQSRDPYRIWVSEIMLQQTQVATVIPYYERFVARFPTVDALARAPEEEVLALWSGLGYYARGRNHLRAARRIVEDGGAFPRDFDSLWKLPGIGRSTAAAIAAFAGGERRAILDGNVRRVLARHGGVGGDPASAPIAAALWALAEARLPARAIEGYTQGLMDLGATVCTGRNPACGRCPVADDCVARIEERIDELPGKRRKPERPAKSTCMLVVIDRGEVLLEKRPSPGIWGGLWSLPECGEHEVPRGATRLEPFTHAFTHFTLAVTPWRVRAAPAAAAPHAARLWLPLSELAGAALPSPVRKLLSRSGSAASGSGAGPRGAASRRSARGASASRRS
jgi:A/G-specific adenine glycosylase